MKHRITQLLLAFTFLITTSFSVQAESLLLEAESFDDQGGWSLDTQFIEIMGSPYLLAHGLGRPVEDASTVVEFPQTGTYQVYVRTMNWVAKFKDAKGEPPGQFQVHVAGKPLNPTFGTESAEWFWQPGGTVEITENKTEIKLHDLTGFEGRCDAIWFTTETNEKPPTESKILSSWRKSELGLPEEPQQMGPFDLVVVGGVILAWELPSLLHEWGSRWHSYRIGRCWAEMVLPKCESGLREIFVAGNSPELERLLTRLPIMRRNRPVPTKSLKMIRRNGLFVQNRTSLCF